MTIVSTADRMVVSVTATDSGDWQVVSVPTGFRGITAPDFAENDYLHGFVRHEDGEQWEVYDFDGGDDSKLLQVTSITGTVTLARPATPWKSNRSDGARMDAGSGTHTMTIALGAGSMARILRELSPFWKTFSSADASPSVAGYRWFKTNGTTAITRFDDMTNGQGFWVRRGGSDIVIQHDGTNIDLFGATNLTLTTASPAVYFAVESGIAKQMSGLVHPLDEDDFASNSAVLPPSQQSVKAYVASQILDEDDFASNSTSKAPSQQSVKAYVDTGDDALGDRIDALFYNTRAAFVSAGIAPADGVIVQADGYRYRRRAASTAISDLTGWDPLFPTPFHFGSAGDGTGDDSGAIEAAITYCGDNGIKLFWGGAAANFRVTAGVDYTMNGPFTSESDGATIIYDGTGAEFVLNFVSDGVTGYDFIHTGPLTIDCNDKAFIAIKLRQLVTTGTLPILSITGLGGMNACRTSTAYTIDGCIGYLRGGWRNVYLRGCWARNVHMATGAGVSGSYGVCGWALWSTAGASFREANIVDMDIEDIYSDDATYYADQDGLKIFTEEDDTGVALPWLSHFTVQGGSFRNCRGRSIKSQCEMGAVIGAKFSRNDGWVSGSTPIVGLGEIEFQVGAGIVQGCEFHYETFVPNRIVSGSGTRENAGTNKISGSVSVQNCKVYAGGDDLPTMGTIVHVNPQKTENYRLVVNDLEVNTDTGVTLADTFCDALASAGSDQTVYMALDKIKGRVNNSFVYATGPVSLDYTISSCINLATSVPYSTLGAGASVVGRAAIGNKGTTDPRCIISSGMSGVTVISSTKILRENSSDLPEQIAGPDGFAHAVRWGGPTNNSVVIQTVDTSSPYAQWAIYGGVTWRMATSAFTARTDNTADLGETTRTFRAAYVQTYYAGATKVVGARKTGWATATGTATRTTFDTATVTLPQVAERLKALIDDLHATAGHGLIGT